MPTVRYKMCQASFHLAMPPLIFFRYNLTGSGLCQLGKYAHNGDRNHAFTPGPIPTFYRMVYTSDNCYFSALGPSALESTDAFCARLGARLAEIRSDGDEAKIRELTDSWVSLHGYEVHLMLLYRLSFM